jgi:hypothetical protein
LISDSTAFGFPQVAAKHNGVFATNASLKQAKKKKKEIHKDEKDSGQRCHETST